MDILDTCFDEFNLNEKKSSKGSRSVIRKSDTAKKKPKNGYKPVLVDLMTLKHESIEIGSQLQGLIDEWNRKNLNDFDVTSLYILYYLLKRYKNRFLQDYDPIILVEGHVESMNIQQVDLFATNVGFKQRFNQTNTQTVFDLVNNFNLHSVPRMARCALVKWHLGLYKIIVYTRVPSVEEVINMQANESRCVTLSVDNLDSLVEGHRDALSFVLHDLVHAFKMFENPVLFRGQVSFSILMQKLVKHELIQNMRADDEVFCNHFDYIASDMNSHTKHLFFTLKTALINAFKRKYNLDTHEFLHGESLNDFNESFDCLLDVFEMDKFEKQAAHDILANHNTTDYYNVDFTILNRFFLGLYEQKFNKKF